MDRNEIINKEFSHSFWGYDVVEVDLFLDEVIRELDRLHNELDIASLTAEAARQREGALRERMEKLRASLKADPERSGLALESDAEYAEGDETGAR